MRPQKHAGLGGGGTVEGEIHGIHSRTGLALHGAFYLWSRVAYTSIITRKSAGVGKLAPGRQQNSDHGRDNACCQRHDDPQALGSQDRNWLRDGALVLIGTALLALSAKIQIPFYPVPMTMQSLVVMKIGGGLWLASRGLTLLAYLAEGAMGLPVFASGAGLATWWADCRLSRQLRAGGHAHRLSVRARLSHSVLGAVAVLSLGHAINLALGFAWLATLIGPELAFAKGVVPFAYATVLKVGLGAALLPASWWAVRTFRKL